MNITLTARAFNPRSRSGEDVWTETITPSPEALDAALRRLRGDGTADLMLEHQGRRLYVAGGPDRFNVLADLGDDQFYDLISDPSLRGWHPLLLGGQLTPTPQRHLAPLEDALQAALTFLEQGTVPISPRWERQLPSRTNSWNARPEFSTALLRSACQRGKWSPWTGLAHRPSWYRRHHV